MYLKFFVLVLLCFSQTVSANNEKGKIEYHCGKKCLSYSKAELAIYGVSNVEGQEGFLKSYAQHLERKFYEEMKRLPGYKKIDFAVKIVSAGTPSRFHVSPNTYNTYIVLNKNNFSKKLLSINAISPINDGFYYRNEYCEFDNDYECLSKHLDQIFDEQLRIGLKDSYPIIIQ